MKGRRAPWHHRARHTARRSLKWRLVGLFLLLGVAMVVVFVSGTRQWFHTGWRDVGRPLIADYVDRLSAEIGNPPNIARAQALAQRLPLAIRIEGPQVQWDSHPQRRQWHTDGPRDPAFRALLVRTTADGHRLTFGVGDWPWSGQPSAVGWFTLAALLLLTAVAFLSVRRLFRPVDDIRAGVLRYGAGEFGQPIPVRRRDELGELATQVNTMATNLQRMLEGQRGLLLAISHELRSPLTRARLNAELVAEGPERDALLRDLAAMRDLINDLLESERLAAGAGALRREPTDLAELARSLLAEGFAGEPIALQLSGDVHRVLVDRSRIQLLLRNLLDNALRHGGGTPVDLRLAGEGGQLTIVVRDHGGGVDPAQMARLAEPFYRPDAARSRDRGGVGLGLTLCRLVAQSHGGTLRFSAADPGLRVTVDMPSA